MKHNSLILIACVAMVASSCARDGEPAQEEGQHRLVLTASLGAATRATTDNCWDGGGGVMAWYPAEDGTVQLADQSSGLAYILQGKMADRIDWGYHYRYEDEIPLIFEHLLAKVRVKLEGDRALDVSKVELYGYTSCTHGEVNYTTSTAPYRTISTDGAQQGWITTHPVTYADGNTYREASMAPGAIDASSFVRLNGTKVASVGGLAEIGAGKLHTVTINAK